jgi:capsular polysaccharide transport system permease protein
MTSLINQGRGADRGMRAERQQNDSRTHRPVLEALRLQIRVIGALILRETRTRFGTSRLGYIWALLEPIVHIAVLSIVYLVFMRRAPVGTSLSLFFVTGIIPYFLYDKTAQRLAGAINANRALLHLALVKNLDVIVGRALLELATILLVLLLLLTTLYSLGQMVNVYIEPLIMAQAIALTWLLGLGIGSINAVLNTMIKSWDMIFKMLTRPLYLLSGVFFMVERVPPPFGDYLRYNPLVHSIDLFRSAFFPGYGRYTIDVSYLASWAVVTVLIGFTLERLLRKKISASVK